MTDIQKKSQLYVFIDQKKVTIFYCDMIGQQILDKVLAIASYKCIDYPNRIHYNWEGR